jgi:hypothetical protein
MHPYALGEFDAESLHAGQEAFLDFLPGNEEINVQELLDMARHLLISSLAMKK